MPVGGGQVKELIYSFYRSNLHSFPKFQYWYERDYVNVYILISSVNTPKNLPQTRVLFLPM